MKEVIKFDKSFNEYSIIEKTNYIEKLLEKNELILVINSLICENDDVLECFSIISKIFKKQKIKTKYNLTNNEVTSLLINSLINQNKTKELNKYLNSLNSKKLKTIVDYEVSNKTAFSKLKICSSLYKKYKGSTTNKKTIENDLTKDISNNELKKKSNKSNSKIKKVLKKEIKSKKVKWSIGSLIIILVFVFSYIFVGYIYSIILFYNNHVYPNIYLDGKLISEESHDDIREYLNTIENRLDDTVKLINLNDSYEFKYKDIGISVNIEEIEKNIIDTYKDLNGFSKLFQIFTNEKLEYEVVYKIDENKYQEFLEELESKVNKAKKEESFSIKNGKIIYQKGTNGFLVDTTNLNDLILDTIKSNSNEIKLNGKVENVSNTLSLINTKVATYTTYYNEQQGRAKNIRNAVSKLNGKILYPNEVFSFYKTVGPYNGSRGYIFYDKDVGSGVCQVSTTIYNVQLLLNLPTVSRFNHGEMVYYVDYGMDATVYGSSVDYKFKNNTSYPIYIEATASSGTLTVSFWSNNNIVKPGYSYKPRVETVGYLSYRTYLDTYYNDKYVGTTFLNSSKYSKGK